MSTEAVRLRDFREGDYVVRGAGVSPELVTNIHDEGCRVTLFLANGSMVSGAPGREVVRERYGAGHCGAVAHEHGEA